MDTNSDSFLTDPSESMSDIEDYTIYGQANCSLCRVKLNIIGLYHTKSALCQNCNAIICINCLSTSSIHKDKRKNICKVCHHKEIAVSDIEYENMQKEVKLLKQRIMIVEIEKKAAIQENKSLQESIEKLEEESKCTSLLQEAKQLGDRSQELNQQHKELLLAHKIQIQELLDKAKEIVLIDDDNKKIINAASSSMQNHAEISENALEIPAKSQKENLLCDDEVKNLQIKLSMRIEANKTLSNLMKNLEDVFFNRSKLIILLEDILQTRNSGNNLNYRRKQPSIKHPSDAMNGCKCWVCIII